MNIFTPVFRMETASTSMAESWSTPFSRSKVRFPVFWPACARAVAEVTPGLTMILQGTGGKIMLLGVGTVAGKSSPVPSVVVVPVGFPSAPGQVKVTVVAVTSQPIPVPRPGLSSSWAGC